LFLASEANVLLAVPKISPPGIPFLEVLSFLIIFLIYKQAKFRKNLLISRLRRANVWEPVGAETGEPEG
jgi:hypothetical protein